MAATQRRRVLIQAGHVAPREPGFEAGTGTTREQELAGQLQRRLVALLAADGRFAVTACPGDIPDGWTGDLFLSLHGDGSADPRTSGFCYGYPPGCHACETLAGKLRYQYEQIPGRPAHRTDNYTRNLTGYYGWRRVNAAAKVLVEHGFLTNPAEREWLFAHLDEIAEAHHRAICAFYGWRLRPKPSPRPPIPASRLAVLRAWLLSRLAAGWTWARIKRTANWREYRRGGGR